MSDWQLFKRLDGSFVPSDPQTQELADKVRVGRVIHGKFSQMRNPRFHRKFFALLNFAFDLWEPGEIDSKYGQPEKNFERFREDVTILAGFYHVSIRLDGSTRIEADSISFANMDQERFESVYNGVLNVLLKRIPSMMVMDADEVNNVVDQIIGFG